MNTKIVAFGEALIRYQAKADSFFTPDHLVKAYPGGSEVNTAVRLAKLGLPVKFVSAAPDTKLTRDYLKIINQRNVDTSNFIFSGNRLGSYYLLSVNGLTKGEVIYDRKYSSFSQLKKGDIDWDAVFEDCRWFHWTAITPALSQQSADLMEEGLQKAAEKNIPISVDLNYRSKLWKYGKKPHEIMPQLTQYCNVILGNIWASNIMLKTNIDENLNDKTTPEQFLEFATTVSQEIFGNFPKAELVAHTFRFMKNEKHNLLYGTAHKPEENAISDLRETHHIVDRIGSGDAFMAGIISAYIQQKSLIDIVNTGVEEGYQKLFTEGDF